LPRNPLYPNQPQKILHMSLLISETDAGIVKGNGG
jgi:hypothetical protein